jgi:hypothetical protein
VAERKKILLRLDPEVYEAVARWAGDELRSVNAQIEYALRLALRSAGRAPHPDRAAHPPHPPHQAGSPSQGEPGSGA